MLRQRKLNARPLSVGERTRINNLVVLATRAEHRGRRHPLSRGDETLAYLVEEPASIYFAGDTDVFAGMAEIAPVDVALLPVWGWGATLGPGHMDPEAAARALVLLRPRIAVPIHWGTLFPIGLARWRSDRLTEPPHAFARHAARLAPEVQVRILEPGATLDVREALA
jgi:L-ascorbate metabolism protein UlaG (beta-lactamase superfamily)